MSVFFVSFNNGFSFKFFSSIPAPSKATCSIEIIGRMYIIYDRNQREIRLSGGVLDPSDKQGFQDFRLQDSEVPDFKPSWLVRVSDMKVVEGSTVNDHYWALSYSWNQSGEIFQTGKEEYDRIDEGKHQIVTYPKHRVWKKLWREKRFDSTKTTTQLVKFEDVIQQICSDIGIQYIWYDQRCIDQKDHDAKVQEIKKMHLIYQNARCTLALIPELEFTGAKNEYGLDFANEEVIPVSHWSKRIWTLEEAYKSRAILFVGRNVHFWMNSIIIGGEGTATRFFQNIHQKEWSPWRACTVLWYARSRTSSKAHDRIFALVNIFPELKDWITFSYKQPVLDLMQRFYGLLAQKDHSIMLFGAPLELDPDDEIAAVRQSEASYLPSWTGANGLHISQDMISGAENSERTVYRSINEGSMHLVSTFIPVCITTADEVEGHDSIDDRDEIYTEKGLPSDPYYRTPSGEKWDVECEAMTLTLVSVPNESQDAYNTWTKAYGLKATHFLPVKQGDGNFVNTLSKPTNFGGVFSLTEECSECFILTGIRVKVMTYFTRCHPVIMKYKEYYKSIGVCFFLPDFNFCSVTHVQQDFDIV